jgi:hypothetical protein
MRRRDELAARFSRRLAIYFKFKARETVDAGQPMPALLEFTPDEATLISVAGEDTSRFGAEIAAERAELYVLIRASGFDPDQWLVDLMNGVRAALGEFMATPGVERSTSKH